MQFGDHIRDMVTHHLGAEEEAGGHAGLLGHGPGPSTVAKCYRLLRAILNTAVEDRHLVANPCTIKGAGVEPCDERAIPTVPRFMHPPTTDCSPAQQVRHRPDERRVVLDVGLSLVVMVPVSDSRPNGRASTDLVGRHDLCVT